MFVAVRAGARLFQNIQHFQRFMSGLFARMFWQPDFLLAARLVGRALKFVSW
jgi:hypothetical protein